MSPREKYDELKEAYTIEYIEKIADHMVLYYSGIGQTELREFWVQVGDITFNK